VTTSIFETLTDIALLWLDS